MINGVPPEPSAVPTDNSPAPRLDPTVPNIARVYDYFLGGKDNFAADRAMAEHLLQIEPAVEMNVRDNRAFLERAVHHAAREGLRQFLDVGSGLPTQRNVHQVAHATAPSARVVYVDNDAVAAAHGRALLDTGDGRVRMVQADVRDVNTLLADRTLMEVLDFSQPIAVIMVALLHFVPGDEPYEILRILRERLVPGSRLVISHATPGAMTTDAVRKAVEAYKRASQQMHLRSLPDIKRMFQRWALSPEGLVPVTMWRPDGLEQPEAPRGGYFAGGVATLEG
ncbi:SAM-dependent methyltransferase [Streptosporangium canum]|uniref:SAM-dependent methyltransferase n=1 Tax=Streptosporangium canum TaxID=324952 RepID=UPI0037A2C2DB